MATFVTVGMFLSLNRLKLKTKKKRIANCSTLYFHIKTCARRMASLRSKADVSVSGSNEGARVPDSRGFCQYICI